MMKNVIPQPGAKYAPLPIGEDGCSLEFDITVGQNQTPKSVLEEAGLRPVYYRWEQIGSDEYHVIGHYTCPP